MTTNSIARKFVEICKSHGLSIRAVADVAGISESVIRNFRDIDGRVPNVSTRILIARSLHVLTADYIDIVDLFGIDGDAGFNHQVNQEKFKPVYNLIKARGLIPYKLAKEAGVGVGILPALLDGDIDDDAILGNIARVLNVGVDRIKITSNDNVDAESAGSGNISLIDRVSHLYIFSGLDSDQVAAYAATLVGGRNVMLEAAEDAVRWVTGQDSPFGQEWSLRRLYYMLYLKELLEKQIKEMTRPRLADLVRMELIMLTEDRTRFHIQSSDGSLYVRYAYRSEGYLEIGSPDFRGKLAKPDWLADVLEGIETCTPFFARIVMTDPVRKEDLAEVFLERGWRKTLRGEFEFGSKGK